MRGRGSWCGWLAASSSASRWPCSSSFFSFVLVKHPLKRVWSNNWHNNVTQWLKIHRKFTIVTWYINLILKLNFIELTNLLELNRERFVFINFEYNWLHNLCQLHCVLGRAPLKVGFILDGWAEHRTSERKCSILRNWWHGLLFFDVWLTVAVCLSFCLSACPSLPVCLSVCLPVCLSVCLSVCLLSPLSMLACSDPHDLGWNYGIL